MSLRDNNQKCVLVVIADGFEETDAIVILSLLRQAGICVKSVGLISGLIGSAHGVWIMPDLTLADLDRSIDGASIGIVILPEGRQSLARLEADPRVHRLLRRVVAQRGHIVTSAEGLRVPRAAALWGEEPGMADDDQRMPVLLRERGQSPEVLALDLIRRLKQPSLA
jgi:putative intracellular protease/amidase